MPPPLEKMRTLDPSPAARQNAWTRICRDGALLRRIAGMLWQYWTEGQRIRREYRQREAKGETYWLDERGPTRHRDAHITGER